MVISVAKTIVVADGEPSFDSTEVVDDYNVSRQSVRRGFLYSLPAQINALYVLNSTLSRHVPWVVVATTTPK